MSNKQKKPNNIKFSYSIKFTGKLQTGGPDSNPVYKDFERIVDGNFAFFVRRFSKDDVSAMSQSYEYMFGKAFLTAPVTEPGVNEWTVYLPKSASWYDFWTGKQFNGGQNIKTDAALDKIPLFVKAGSIITVGPKVQFAEEKRWDNLEIRIYEGADGKFTLYEDENDNYNYEKGSYSAINFNWDNTKKILTIDSRKGSFPGMLADRKFNIVYVSQNIGKGIDTAEKSDKEITYTGNKIVVKK
jgi:alpha-D-xyloside xylohydrolase